ncbi:sugar transferase [Sphingobium sp. SCG-1]|nr:sugar transferase [Sphingobium sp. SCG-1]
MEQSGSIIAVKPAEKRLRRISLYAELIALDSIAIAVAFFLVGLIRLDAGALSGLRLSNMLIPVYIGYAIQGETYSSTALLTPRVNASKALTALLYAVITVIFFLFAIRAAETVSRLTFGAGAALSAIFLVSLRFAFCRYAATRLDGAPINELLIVDDVEIECPKVRHVVSTRAIGFEPDLGNPEMLQRLGLLVDGFERVVVACTAERRTRWTMLLRGANINGEIVAPEFDSTGVVGIGLFDGHDTHIVSRGPLSTSNRAKKRALDLLLTVPAIIALTPLLLVVAIAIRLDSPGPILFKQNRIGRGNRMFKIMKFRSMRVETSDGAGNRSASRDDDRVTRIGKFIRSTSIDELPQLFNVLIGDMSLVGPRPHALGSMAGNQLFWEVDHKYWMRHSLKPGITGLAQVRGYRGATEVPDDLINRLGADLEYIESWTLGRELVILARTLGVVVHRNAF